MVTNERKLIVDFECEFESYDGSKNPQQESMSQTQRPIIQGAQLLSLEGKTATYSFDPNKVKASDLIKHVATTYDIQDVLVHNASIEEIIAELYQVLDI